jgi:hypothetical protein
MSASESSSNAATEHRFDERLDSIDRALLGLLPRSERLTFVAQVETRLRELAEVDGELGAALQPRTESGHCSDAVSRRPAPSLSRRVSRLAVSSGIFGIVALVLLFAMPATYFLVAFLGEELDETILVSLLGIHVLAVAIGGMVSLAMGTAGLISLARNKGKLKGHGWAITGLCTAPLPSFVGGLLVLVACVSLVAAQEITVEGMSSSPPIVISSSSRTVPAVVTTRMSVAASPSAVSCEQYVRRPNSAPEGDDEVSVASYQAPVPSAPAAPSAAPAPAAASAPAPSSSAEAPEAPILPAATR